MITDVYLYYYKLILIQEESPCNETDKANKRRFIHLIRISEMGVINFADKVGISVKYMFQNQFVKSLN